jgi:GntR family colanic acid and biofilm gene transcriptional regulator
MELTKIERKASQGREQPEAKLDEGSGLITRVNLSTRAEEYIRSALLAGKFAPGDRISLVSLAETLGMSVTPVREAISRVAAERALELAPGQTARVPPFDPARFRELLDIRITVEGMAVERAAERVTRGEISKIRQTLAKFLQASRAHELEKLLLLSRDFRFLIYSASKMPALVRIIEGLWLQSAPSFKLMNSYQRDERLEKHYIALVENLAARDAEAARATITDSIRAGTERLMRIMEL